MASGTNYNSTKKGVWRNEHNLPNQAYSIISKQFKEIYFLSRMQNNSEFANHYNA